MANISHPSTVRGADGRLYSLSVNGVAEVAEAPASARAALRAGDRKGFDSFDQEAARTAVMPGV